MVDEYDERMADEMFWAGAYEKEALTRYSMTPAERMIADGIFPEKETAGSAGSGVIVEEGIGRMSPWVPCLLMEPASGSITGVSRSVKEVPL
jgi:hypothetical protein